LAVEKAKEMIAEHSSDNATLKDALVEAGFWNGETKTFHPTTLPPSGINNRAAIRVTVSRAEGSNGGPVVNLFMQLFGKDKTAVGSEPAVAVYGGGNAGSLPPSDNSNFFPMALSKCMTDHYFSQSPMPDPPPQIIINSPYLPGGESCSSGQWTSLTTGSNDVPTIREFMDSGNPEPLKVGDKIWIEPGAEASLYSPTLTNWLPDGGKDVIMAIVDTGTSSLSVKGALPITGFVTFHIDGAVGGSAKYVYGHFTNTITFPTGATPDGSTSNVWSPPRLVQ
jgi:hypothetical protein